MKLIFTILVILIVFHFGQGQTIDTLISVGGNKLHFNIIKGKGTPIIFESGNGDDASVWNDLLKPIHDLTGAPLITFDRAGLGKSEIDSTKNSFKQEIKDLKKSLKKLGYTKNYFLVAHSFGGVYASEFTNKNKGKINGAVFVDVATPCELSIERTTRIKNSISDDNWKLLKQYKIGLYYVLINLPDIAKYMSKRYISNSIPLTLIAAENHIPTEEIGEIEQDMLNWEKCLREFGNLPNHKYVATKNTDHKVWEKDPQTVINEIIKLYNQTKKYKNIN